MRSAASIARRTFAVAVGLCPGVLATSAAGSAGPVIGWGNGSTPSITASAISVGLGYACAIQAGSGRVVCWGSNVSGQATPPDTVNGAAGAASAIAAGGQHALAIRQLAATVPSMSPAGVAAVGFLMLLAGGHALRRGRLRGDSTPS